MLMTCTGGDGLMANKVGRPAFAVTETVCEQAMELASKGLTLNQISRVLGIATGTLCAKKVQYPELEEAIKTGRAMGVGHVSNALYQNAMDGNVTAQIFYLKNRAPDEWKDRREETLTFGEGGLPLNINVIFKHAGD